MEEHLCVTAGQETIKLGCQSLVSDNAELTFAHSVCHTTTILYSSRECVRVAFAAPTPATAVSLDKRWEEVRKVASTQPQCHLVPARQCMQILGSKWVWPGAHYYESSLVERDNTCIPKDKYR